MKIIDNLSYNPHYIMNDIIQVIHNCIVLTKQIVDNTVRSGANIPGMITACQKLETLLFDKYIYSSKNKDDIIMFNIILSTASKAAINELDEKYLYTLYTMPFEWIHSSL